MSASESDDEVQRARREVRLKQAIVIGLGLLIGILILACLLGAMGVYLRVLPPPAFAVRLGPLELAAPCPPRHMVCDESTPFYALWRGEYHPDGSVSYYQLYFIYLKHVRDRAP